MIKVTASSSLNLYWTNEWWSPFTLISLLFKFKLINRSFNSKESSTSPVWNPISIFKFYEKLTKNVGWANLDPIILFDNAIPG